MDVPRGRRNEARRESALVRRQAVAAAAVNAVLNPLLAWVTHRDAPFIPIAGPRGVIADAVVTSLLLSLLVSLLLTHAAREARAAGHLSTWLGPSFELRVLRRLPRRPWAFGLVIGAVAAVVVGVALRLLHAAGMNALPLAQFVATKAAWTALLGFLVARWAILRHLAGLSARVDA